MATEIKYTISPKLTKGFIIATEDLEAPYNIIITPGKARFPLKENVEVCDIDTWVSERLPELIQELL